MSGKKQEPNGYKRIQAHIRDNGTAVWVVATSREKLYNLTTTYHELEAQVDVQIRPTLTLFVESITLTRGANHSKNTEKANPISGVAIDK